MFYFIKDRCLQKFFFDEIAVIFFAPTEGSTNEESICNESSVYESDSTFYKQSKGLWSNISYLDMYGLLYQYFISFIQWTFENTSLQLYGISTKQQFSIYKGFNYYVSL